MFLKRSKGEKETPLIAPLQQLLANSQEAMAIIEPSGKIILKNNKFTIAKLNELLPVPATNQETVIQHKEQMLRFTQLNEQLILAKQLTPNPNAELMPPLLQLAQKLNRNQALLPSVIQCIETLLPDTLILVFKHIQGQTHYSVEAARYKEADIPNPALKTKTLPVESERLFIDNLKKQMPELFESLPSSINEAQALFYPYQDKQKQNLGFIVLINQKIDLERELMLLETITDLLHYHLQSSENKAIGNPALLGEKVIASLPGMDEFNKALSSAELEKRNRLLVLIRICDPSSPDCEQKERILNTVAQLLSSFWRSGDKLFYLPNDGFAILYHNVPDISLVKLRLGSMDNVIHYKGFKNTNLQIGYSTLEKAGTNSEKMLENARHELRASQNNY